MKVSYNWLQDYFDKTLPVPEKLGELLTIHAFEVESIEKKGDDSVLDVKVLPDRSHDCLSHKGIALEVGFLANIPVKPKMRDIGSISLPESNVLKIEVENSKICKRFSALVMENIEVKDSPDWLVNRLEAIGQRSINNIVDATNYVMFAFGQPLHAYDRDLLKETDGGWKILVREAREGESLTALDNKEYKLDIGELAIVDGNSDLILGIAGVKGGKACEISKCTKHIILEAANFDPILIRKTSKRIGLRTDASVRFENEITPELTTTALKAVSDLIFKIAGTDETQVEGLVDAYPQPAALYKLGFSLSEVQGLIGIDISYNEVEDILVRRGYEFKFIEPSDLLVKLSPKFIGVPYKLGASILRDAPRFFDCSSLVSYLYAQVGISIPRMTVDQLVFGENISKDDLDPGDLVFSNSGVGKIHKESIEFMPGVQFPEGVDHVGIYMGDGIVIHTSRPAGVVVEENLNDSSSFDNPVGYRRFPALQETRYVISVPAERLDLRLKEDFIEEIGRVYGYKDLKSRPIKPFFEKVNIDSSDFYSNVLRKFFAEHGYSEVITYAFQKKGDVEIQNPLASDKAFLRSSLSDGLGEAFALNARNADFLGLVEVKIFEIGNVFTNEGEHLAVAFAGGGVEEIKRKISELNIALDFKTENKVSEANFSLAIKTLPQPSADQKVSVSDIATAEDSVRFKPFSQYPVVLRDIAVFVPEADDHNEIIEVVKSESDGLLMNYRLFDTFTKDFPEGKKTSYAYRLVFQSFEKTLSDDEINPIMERVTGILNSMSGWQVR